jgi:hypothetical protein
MEQIERICDYQELLRQTVWGILADVWTAVPCTIAKFDPATGTADVNLVWPLLVDQKDGTQKLKQCSKLPKCPVIFMQGGGFTIFAPPKVGQEALAIFAQRSIDDWWVNSGVQPRHDLRQFSKNDAFIICGCFSKPKVPANIDPDALVICNPDLSIAIRMDANGITITAPQVTINGQTQINSDLSVDGDLAVSGDTTTEDGKISLETHVHTGVQSGSAESGPPKTG